MITIQATRLSVFYLLKTGIEKYHIPDHIPYNEDHFFYSKNEFLAIEGSNEVVGFYKLKIFPVENTTSWFVSSRTMQLIR